MDRGRTYLLMFVLTPGIAFVASCATPSPPKEELRRSETVITQAVEAGAECHAPEQLDLAQTKLALARRWLGQADPEAVHWLLEQAQVDAELAAAKTSTATMFRRVNP